MANQSGPTTELKLAWQLCYYCSVQTFKTSSDFVKHLRDRHCTKEGGSFVCRYGYNGVCASLPLDGVSDRDYESHVTKYHVNQVCKGPEQWSVFSSSQNLPAVLNDPSRGKQSNLFTKKWGDSFVEKLSIPASPHLVDISYGDFDAYMKKIGRRYRRHIRLSQTVSDHQHDSSPSTSSSSHHLKSFGELNDSNLNDIPPIFLKPNLELNNAATFAQVFPGIGIDDDKEKHSGRLLQEKLSHYLDIVEVQIAKQVSQKSSAFFHAMTSQDTIMEEMNAATANVKKLRNEIQHLDATLVKDSLKILSAERKRTHNHIVLRKMKVMAEVHQTQPMIQLLLGTQDYVAAIDLISSTQELVAKELVGVHCFKHLPSQLKEMERLIDKMLTTDFEKYSTADLNRPLSHRNEPCVVLDEDKLVCIISGLLRQKNFSFIDTYKEEATVTATALIKQMVIEVISSSDSDICLTGAGEEAQSLSITDWVVLLETATETLLKLLHRIRAVLDVMHRIADASAGQDSFDFIEADTFLSEIDHRKVKQKLRDVMHSICNYCHERCATLTSSQSLEKTVATAEQLEKLTVVVTRFSEGCERLSGSKSFPLKAALKAQGSRFALKFHSDRKSKMALILDSERWKQAEVPAEFQRMIDCIARGDFSATVTVKKDDGTSAPPSPVLLVDAEPYALVGAALILVQIISEYSRCASQLSVISMQLSLHVIDLLRMFNSRCCQLVLGAGALHVAGLKTITSGNLALVSRALQLVIWLLPHIKRHYNQIEPGPSANGKLNGGGPILTGYDAVEKDVMGHIKEVESKVLSIVGLLVNSQMDNWTARPPVPSQSFRNISRHFVKLHEAIAPILPDHQVQCIYRVVHKTFKDKLRELLLRNNIVNNGGPQHGVVTSELTFYMETLRTLNALPPDELADEAMNDIWLKL